MIVYSALHHASVLSVVLCCAVICILETQMEQCEAPTA